MYLSFAPMEGLTGCIYRSLHAEMFPGADCYYAPFIAPDSQGKFKKGSLRDILPENNQGIKLIPQILTNDASAFINAAERLIKMGYSEINLNAGCPSGTAVAKHKGAGMLSDPEELDNFLEDIFSALSIKISVKTRLGIENSEEFPGLLEIYRKYPLSQLIVHARTKAGMYKSLPDRAAFSQALDGSPFPVCYNGNIFSLSDYESVTDFFPSLDAVMLARGALADPALPRQIKGGAPLRKGELRLFHDRYLELLLSSGLFDDFIIMRLKELWSYMAAMFDDCSRPLKAIYKSRRVEDYKNAVSVFFSSCELSQDAHFTSVKR